MGTKLDKKGVYLLLILVSLLLNFTAVGIIRLWIQQLFDARRMTEYTALHHLIDNLSTIPIIYWCAVSFSVGLVVMFGVMWAIRKD